MDDKPIRVVLADDHGVVRAGIKSLLEAEHDIVVVGEAATGEEAVQKASELRPNVVLMDLAMPGIGGIEATRLIKAKISSSNVLVLTMHDNEEYFFAVLEAGASGYVLKGSDPQDLIAAVHAVNQGNAFLAPEVAKVVLSSYVRGMASEQEDKENFNALSPREKELFNLVAEGKTNREIAETLYLSVRTVEKHRANMMSKLGLSNRAEFIKYAIRTGLMDTGVD